MEWLKRDAEQRLEEWFATPSRSPLVIFGPRQVGKTALAKHFASKHFGQTNQNIVSINFYKDVNDRRRPKRFASIFEATQDPKEILTELEILLDREINPDKTIILLDEIQECLRAYEVLKLFKDEYPQLAIIATGSYMRLFLEQISDIKHPVGCTEELSLHPLSFREFLQNYSSILYKEYVSIDINRPKQLSQNLHDKFMEALEYYFFTGGMPEVVFNFLKLKQSNLPGAIRATKRKKAELFSKYHYDLEKYSKHTDVKKIKRIFEQIPTYLEKFHEETVERFKLKQLKEGTRYKEVKSAFDYLKYSGLIIQTFFTKVPTLPFHIGVDDNERGQFKCYLFDVGILNSRLGISYKTLSTKGVGHYKGYIAENFVAQQISKYTQMDELYCYKRNSNKDSAEIEFIIEKDTHVIPIEVKSSKKSLKSKSLDSYITKFRPKYAFKCTPANFSDNNGYLQIPLYLIEKIFDTG
ncbi:MAG: ATP-binding protein [Bacteriovoracaceae bacterium]|nr:ATP-binding protein [Bacteriovoracaceae bacterium]